MVVGIGLMPTLVLQLFFALLALSCVYAVVAGGRDARIAVGLMVAAVLLTRAVTLLFAARWPLMIVDMALLLGFWRLSLSSRRYWPLWVMGLHGVSVAGHLAIQFGPPIPYPVYHGIIGVWSIPVLISMTLGIMLDQKAGISHGASNPTPDRSTH